MSIDVRWVGAVNGRVVLVDGERLVSVDNHVLLSNDALRFPLRTEHSRRAGSEKRSVCSLLLLNCGSTSVFLDYLSPDLGPQLLLFGPEKVSIDSYYEVSIDTPFSRRSIQLMSCQSMNLPGSITHGFDVVRFN
ncbi:hypothetical protein IGI04_015746 [Brassica rapa subsp. trilocularis]|uniref:Uncharacterized protein n=1 Tax=Brassica rapa subsp. trilocularis TaxID=1813537 RepID=A0ABQ7MQZ6_BRACM|nr:hypothetical protein IGI04_015746 [Brassica rapa subsp. trilocularis]